MHITKIASVMTILAILLFANGTATAQSNASIPFSFVITAPTEIKAGAEVSVAIKITNTSNSVIGFEAMEVPYMAIVRGAQGNPSAETEKGRMVRDKQTKVLSPLYRGSQFIASLKPGESRTENFTVSDLYDMSRPGHYSIQLQRVWNDRKVQSNSVKIRIIP